MVEAIIQIQPDEAVLGDHEEAGAGPAEHPEQHGTAEVAERNRWTQGDLRLVSGTVALK